MTIGIVTFYNSNNYGAMLQAYALQSYLEVRGHDVIFMKDENRADDPLWKPTPLWKFFSKRNLRPFGFGIRSTLFNSNREIAERRMLRNIVRPFVKKNLHVSTNTLSSGPLPLDLQRAAYIVGSDQVWHSVWKANRISEVFLTFAPAGSKRIAYAASFGGTDWTGEHRSIVSDLLQKFDAIGVREKFGVETVKRISNCHAEHVPDPTLLHRNDFYNNLAKQAGKDSCAKAFVFEYIFRPSAASLFHCKLSSVFKARFRSARCHPPNISNQPTVASWMKNMRDSAFVLTDSFHGTVFAILWHKPFIALTRSGNIGDGNERLVSLLSPLGLSNRMFSEYDEARVDAVLHEMIDWRHVDSIIDSWREHANNFFAKCGL